MSEIERWLFAVGFGAAVGGVAWLVWPLPGLIWRAVCRVAGRPS